MTFKIFHTLGTKQRHIPMETEKHIMEGVNFCTVFCYEKGDQLSWCSLKG